MVRYLFYNSRKFLSKDPFQESILGIFALHVQYHASREEIDDTKPKIMFYALCVLYALSVAVIALDTGLVVVLRSVSNNAALFFSFALIDCTHRTTLVYCSTWPMLSPYYSVAVTFSPNVSLYAQLTILIDSICSSNLQRYTVAGLCGVATSVW